MPGVKLKEGERMDTVTYEIGIDNALTCAYFLKGYLFDANPTVRGKVITIISELEKLAIYKLDEEGDD